MPHFATLKFRHMTSRGGVLLPIRCVTKRSASHRPRVTQAARHTDSASHTRVTQARHSLRDTALLLLFCDMTLRTLKATLILSVSECLECHVLV